MEQVVILEDATDLGNPEDAPSFTLDFSFQEAIEVEKEVFVEGPEPEEKGKFYNLVDLPGMPHFSSILPRSWMILRSTRTFVCALSQVRTPHKRHLNCTCAIGGVADEARYSAGVPLTTK
jgi:hypothetical protein